MIEIKVPENYFEGHDCLEYEFPWQVPDSVFKEAENLNENDVAFELGMGGSTLFLANRVKLLLSIETSQEWFEKVHEKMGLKYPNAVALCFPNQGDIIDYIQKSYLEEVTILSVDTQGGYDRSELLNAFLSKGVSDNLRMVILDNYAHEGLFPLHYNKIVPELSEWDCFTFDHDRWAGNGTRIYIKNK